MEIDAILTLTTNNNKQTELPDYMIGGLIEFTQMNISNSTRNIMDHSPCHMINTQEVWGDIKMNLDLNKSIAELSHFIKQVSLADPIYDKLITIKDKILAWERTINQQHSFFAQHTLQKEADSKNIKNAPEQNEVFTATLHCK